MTVDLRAQMLQLLPIEKGHFRYESGHHSDSWMRLELLYLHPLRMRQFTDDLARRLSKYEIDAICGPLVEGAFVALMVASQMALPFTYAERLDSGQSDALYPVRYRLPGALRKEVKGRRVAIVNDVISAGSAVRGTFADLIACGAQPVIVAALAVLGDTFGEFAAANRLGLEAIVQMTNHLWTPDACPLCKAGESLDVT